MARQSIESRVEGFVADIDSDLDSQVRELSLPDYGEWLKEFKTAINSMIDARIQAQKEDSGE